MGLLAAALAAAVALAVQPAAPAPCAGAARPAARSALAWPRAHARAGGAAMGPKRGRKKRADVPEDEELDEAGYAALELVAVNTEFNVGRGVSVDGMTTRLDNVEELVATAGPPVPEEAPDEVDPRGLYAFLGRYEGGRVPSERLQASYAEWLSELGASPSSRVCLPAYLLAESELDLGWEVGDEVSESEMAALDEEDAAKEKAKERALAKAASLTGEDGEGAEGAAEAEAESEADALIRAAQQEEDSIAPAGDNFDDGAPPMQTLAHTFVLGHLTVVRAESADEAAEWAAADPVALAGGYGAASLLEWARSEDPGLNVAPAADGSSFVVHALDVDGGGALRASTRDDHLRWLKDSGRVCYGGPLLNGGEKVGTMLVVNGDNLDDVRGWAMNDPYAAAGLFDDVTCAPLLSYGNVDALSLELPKLAEA